MSKSTEEEWQVQRNFLLKRCSCEQLARIVKHYEMDAGDKRMKENVRTPAVHINVKCTFTNRHMERDF